MKSLIIPINPKKEILIHDRRGYRAPDWGFFGGNINEGEMPLDAAIRKAKHELGLDLRPEQLEYIGVMQIHRNMASMTTHLYLLKTNQQDFVVHEGGTGVWMSFEEAAKHLDGDHQFEKVAEKIEKLM